MRKTDSMVGAAYSDLIATKSKLLSIIIMQTIALLVLAFLYITTETETIIVPAQVSGEMVIGEGKANEEYQKRFAYSVASLIGNVSPRNIDFVLENIEKMLSPNLRSIILPSLKNEANVMKVRGYEQDYVVKDMIWSTKADMVYVWGEKTTRGGKEVSNDDFTYEIRLKPIDGFPRIVHLKGYKGVPSKNKQDFKKPESDYYNGEVADINAEGESIE